MVRKIDDAERRARLGRNHLLQVMGADVAEVASSVLGIHSSDPATIYLTAWARVPSFVVSDMESALYQKKSLVRILGMRRTMFVVPVDSMEAVHYSSSVALIPAQVKRAIDMIEGGGVAVDGSAWLETASTAVMKSLSQRGTATAAELKEDVPQLAAQIPYYRSDGSLMGTAGMSTRVLFVMALRGLVIRGRPRGTWLSSMYEWATLREWTGVDLTESGDRNDAQDVIVEKWLRSYGPGTERDIKWWTGWPVRDVRASLSRLAVAEVETSEGPSWVMDDDVEPVNDASPWVALLPSLDSTAMGWKLRDWYLGTYQELLYDRNGNAGPTVWVDGRMVGAWAQRPDGEIVYRLLQDVGRESADSLARRAAQLQEWLSEIVVTPRFRSPLEKELATS